MANWIAPAIIAFFCWGLWAFLPKIATQYLSPKSIVVYELVGAAVVAFVLLVTMDFKPQFHPRGVAVASIIGALGVGGSLAFIYAVSKGPVGVISVVTALYPVLTLVLAFFVLQEPISLKQSIGIVLAFIAIFLMST
jgi:transporter family protein